MCEFIYILVIIMEKECVFDVVVVECLFIRCLLLILNQDFTLELNEMLM